MSDEVLLAPLAPKRRWSTPTLTSHASLTALTQMQYPEGFATDSGFDASQQAIACSTGFCPRK